MANLTVKQDGTGDYTTLAAALGDAGLTSGNTITITGTWTIADTSNCTANDSGITITADADATHGGRVTLTGGTGGSPTAAGHYRLEVASGHGITVSQPCTIEKFVVKQNGSGTSDEGIRWNATTTLRRMIVYAASTSNADQDGIYTATAGNTLTMENSVVYKFNRGGVHCQLSGGTTTVGIDSCTIWDCGYDNAGGTRAPGGIGLVNLAGSPVVNITVTNSLVVGNGNSASSDDYRENTITGTPSWNWTIGDCVDSDNSIAGVVDTDSSSNANLASRTVTFGSTAGGNEVIFQSSSPVDLRLVNDATNNDAQDSGATALTEDIVGTSRPQNSTDDRGAFEVVAGGGGFKSYFAAGSNVVLQGV